MEKLRDTSLGHFFCRWCKKHLLRFPTLFHCEPELKVQVHTLILAHTYFRNQKVHSSQSTYVHTMLVFSYMVPRNVITQREPFNMIRNCQMFRISKFFWPYLSSQRYKTFFSNRFSGHAHDNLRNFYGLSMSTFFQDHWLKDELISEFYISTYIFEIRDRSQKYVCKTR